MGLAHRIALALTATAVVAVGVSALLVESGLRDRVRDSSEARLRTATRHTAQLAADEYAEKGRWTPAAVVEVEHAAVIPGYRVVVRDVRDQRLPSVDPGPGGPAVARSGAEVQVGGVVVGRIVLEAPQALLAAEEEDLVGRLRQLHLFAAALAVAAALLIVLPLTGQVVRPIRRLRDAVVRMPDGARAPTKGPREVVELARSFNALADALEQEERTRRVMAADVAHELRTPLNGMLLRIEAAQDGVLPDAEANFEAMHAGALRLSALITDVERLAEAERPGVLLDWQALDMAEIVRERLVIHRPAFADAGIAVTADLSAAPVQGDSARLGQVVDNLLTNALRYTDPAGTVEIRVALIGREAVLDVADTGIGISAEDLPHVFDRFWRADRSRSRATGGSGVGLAVAERLVKAHGGVIEVDSERGRGTRFVARVPRSRS